jgi:hypothetical protein
MDEDYQDPAFLNDLPLWADEDARKVLEALCLKNKVPIDVISELVTEQRMRQHQERAHGINARFEEILGAVEEL